MQFCKDNNAEFVSGRSMTAPTCIGHGRNGSTLEVGTSVVDHVLRVRSDATRTLALPACTTLDHATHGPVLQLLASNHCPVLFCCGSRAPAATAKRSTRTTWRLEQLHQQQTREAYQLAVRAHAHSALALRVTDQRGVDRMASAVMDMLTDSATGELGRLTIVTGITKNWITPAVKAAARCRRAALHLMLCRPYDASERSNTAAANQEFAAAVRSARGAHRIQLERKCTHHCRTSPGSYAMHKSLQCLAAAPHSQGVPSLRHPVSGATCTTDAAKAAALAAFAAEVARAPAPATQEARASVARAHAALAAEHANLGHDAHGLGVEFTFDEVRDCLRSLKNHKAAGSDCIPAEVHKYSGGTGVNAGITSRCVLSAWRQGVVVHLPRGGDTGDCSNYRPLTLLPVVDKLFAKLLSEPIARAVCLHDQQYAFRPGRGTLNPLQNLLAVVRQRTQANRATYACFFDAAKAYDSVLHTLLLHRLLQCGVVGPVFAILVAVYSSASSRVRVGTTLSPAFVVQRGVTQGCPLSPLLHAIFIDPALQDMQSLSHPDMLWVGPATSRRKLVGQACSGDLAGIAATQQGLQRVVDAVHNHSLRWGWLLNLPKSVVMVFGKRSVCARLGAPELLWGACRLPTMDTVKYLGLRLESERGWAAQQAAGAANGWAALHQWLPVLRIQYLTTATKLLVLRSRIAPCMTYGINCGALPRMVPT